MTRLALMLGFVAAALTTPAANAATALQPVDLRCEYEVNPLGVDVPQPRLAWKLAGDARGLRQTACHILVASTPDLLAQDQGDLWDSGKVGSDETIHIAYAGAPLKTAQTVYWKVKTWDQSGQASAWSQPATWTMGVMNDADWAGARWITAAGATNLVPARKFIGYHAAETRQDEVKWVQVDLGRAWPIESVKLHPMQHANRDGFGFPHRFKVEAADDADFSKPLLIADQTTADFPNPGVKPVIFEGKGVTARFVRVTATKLWLRDTAYCFALKQLEVISGGRNVARGTQVSYKDTVENYGWGAAGLTDGAIEPVKPQPNFDSLRLRREFTVKPGLAQATLFVCGLGHYELNVNGGKVGDALLAPGWTKYDKTCLYDTHDLTGVLRPGVNALGLTLGNGMYRVRGGRYTKFKGAFGPIQAVAQLRLAYADGSTEIIATDSQWKVSAGPITFSCIYGGEDYDARLEEPGWDRGGFNDAAWERAVATAGPGGQLRGMTWGAPPMRALETIRPASVKELRPGVAIYDLGQNAPIMPRLRVRGAAGAVVKITPAELLRGDGALDRGSCGGGEAYWKYTLAGGGGETWFPKFFYHGCRYLQVERLAATPGGPLPEVEQLEGVVVHSASAPVGEFACSNELFNRIRALIRWAQRANLAHVITDCPHRERLGWLEQYHLHGASLRYEFDLARMYAKGMTDMADSQLANGLVPDIAPEYTVFGGGFRDSPEWGSAFVIVPWQQYEWTGDRELLRRHFDGMKRYVDYLSGTAKGHIVSHGLGDWYDVGPRPPGEAQLTPRALTATAFYYYDAEIVARTAALLGRTADAQKYGALAAEIRAAFNAKLYDAAKRQYATGSQCANAMPLVLELAPAEARPALVEAIAADVRARGNAVSAGDVGFRYLLRALADGGRSDVIFDMNNQSEKPGYGYQLKQGATSLTEAWDAGRASSHNHFMLGHIMEWFYHDLAGLGPDPAGPGFKRILIKPQPVGDLAWARARYDSIRGQIASEWKRADGKFLLAVTIPPNTTATVHLPTTNPATVTESGQPAAQAGGVRFLRAGQGVAVFEIASGRYAFAGEMGR